MIRANILEEIHKQYIMYAARPVSVDIPLSRKCAKLLQGGHFTQYAGVLLAVGSTLEYVYFIHTQ